MQKGEALAQGKTKIIWAVEGHSGTVLVQSKDDITAGDGARHDILAGKGALANRTNANIFNLLARAGIPTAFLQQVDETHFLARRCEMLPFEVVIRRRAHGSYLKRHPTVLRDTVLPGLTVEWHLKTTGKRWGDAVLPKDDPLIRFEQERAALYRPDMPIAGATPFLVVDDVPLLDAPEQRDYVEEVARQVFVLLEAEWQRLGYKLCDLKIEFGRTPSDRIVVADVIDNDSWRVLDREGNYVDKQRYRDGEGLEAVLALYTHVAELTDRFSAAG